MLRSSIMFRSATRLWLFPDLGMDVRLWGPQREHFASLDTPKLCESLPSTTLQQRAVGCVERWFADGSPNRLESGSFF